MTHQGQTTSDTISILNLSIPLIISYIIIVK
jgi:hypothetical protein